MEEADLLQLRFLPPANQHTIPSHLHCSGRRSWWLFWLTFSKGTSAETLPLTNNTILMQRTLPDVGLTERMLVQWRNVLEAGGGTPTPFSLSLCFLEAMRQAALLCVSPLCDAQRRHRLKDTGPTGNGRKPLKPGAKTKISSLKLHTRQTYCYCVEH